MRCKHVEQESSHMLGLTWLFMKRSSGNTWISTRAMMSDQVFSFCWAVVRHRVPWVNCVRIRWHWSEPDCRRRLSATVTSSSQSFAIRITQCLAFSGASSKPKASPACIVGLRQISSKFCPPFRLAMLLMNIQVKRSVSVCHDHLASKSWFFFINISSF